MKEFIKDKDYEANKDYFSFKLLDYSEGTIEDLSIAQGEKYSNTWEKFVAFMEGKYVKVEEQSNEDNKDFDLGSSIMSNIPT